MPVPAHHRPHRPARAGSDELGHVPVRHHLAPRDPVHGGQHPRRVRRRGAPADRSGRQAGRQARRRSGPPSVTHRATVRRDRAGARRSSTSAQVVHSYRIVTFAGPGPAGVSGHRELRSEDECHEQCCSAAACPRPRRWPWRCRWRRRRPRRRRPPRRSPPPCPRSRGLRAPASSASTAPPTRCRSTTTGPASARSRWRSTGGRRTTRPTRSARCSSTRVVPAAPGCPSPAPPPGCCSTTRSARSSTSSASTRAESARARPCSASPRTRSSWPCSARSRACRSARRRSGRPCRPTATYTAACGANGGPLLAHMSTLNVVKDLDRLRPGRRRQQAHLRRLLLRHAHRRDLRQPLPDQGAGTAARRHGRPGRAHPALAAQRAQPGRRLRDRAARLPRALRGVRPRLRLLRRRPEGQVRRAAGAAAPRAADPLRRLHGQHQPAHRLRGRQPLRPGARSRTPRRPSRRCTRRPSPPPRRPAARRPPRAGRRPRRWPGPAASGRSARPTPSTARTRSTRSTAWTRGCRGSRRRGRRSRWASRRCTGRSAATRPTAPRCARPGRW